MPGFTCKPFSNIRIFIWWRVTQIYIPTIYHNFREFIFKFHIFPSMFVDRMANRSINNGIQYICMLLLFPIIITINILEPFDFQIVAETIKGLKIDWDLKVNVKCYDVSKKIKPNYYSSKMVSVCIVVCIIQMVCTFHELINNSDKTAIRVHK